MKVLAVLLRLAHDEAVDVAAKEIAGCYCQPKEQDLGQVGKGKIHGYAQVEERVDTVEIDIHLTAVPVGRYSKGASVRTHLISIIIRNKT